MRKQDRTQIGVAILMLSVLVAGRVAAGNLNPTNAPGPTMHTLEEIYQKQVETDQKVSSMLSPLSLSPTTGSIIAGYYAATNLALVDTDLVAGSIATNVTIFGVAGTLSTTPAAVPRTGQTNSYAANDDGAYQRGVALPTPRFTVGASGPATNCVTDNLTGLVWARNANIAGTKAWAAAITYCEGLDYGGQTDWRLPNAKELFSLLDLGRFNPALPAGHPFTGVQSGHYWSSSTCADNTGYAWRIHLFTTGVLYDVKTGMYYVWPVRGGQ